MDGSRKLSRPSIVVIAVALVIVACGAAVVVGGLVASFPVREEISVIPEADVPPAEEPKPAEVGDSGIKQDSEMVAALLMTSSSGWVTQITDVEVATLLRRPVILISTSIGPEQAGLADQFIVGLTQFTSGLSDPGGSPYTYHIRILSSEGDAIGDLSSKDRRWALDAGPPPTDPAELASWIDRVYGAGSPVPEDWTARIKGVSSGPGDIVTFTTDLEPSSPQDLHAAQMIIDAANSSGAAFAAGVRVVFADGEFFWESVLDGVDPYGP